MGNWIIEKICLLLYWIGKTLCVLVDFMYMLFQKFAGVSEVTYRNGKVYLMEIFFGNSQITAVYWGMATIGTILMIFFTIIAVTKKTFDIDEKVKNTHGGIIRGCFKSIFIIISMNFILVATISGTNLLLAQFEKLFNNASLYPQQTSIIYTEEDYAIMARVCNTIGNHSLSASRSNRYNINTCYNEIREDLKTLERHHVFAMDYDYNKEVTKDSWQYALAKIALSMDLSQEASPNMYYPALEEAMNEAFETIQKNNNFHPLREYNVPVVKEISNENTPFGAMLFLTATFDAARNGLNGKDASITDSLRGKYLTGSRNYKDLDHVKADFNLDYEYFNHLTLIISAIFIGLQFVEILVDCIVRIFNMLLLYITAPLFASTIPMDDGSKFKQWTLSFTIQTLSVIGVVVTLRIYMMFVPIIMSGDLQFMDDTYGNMVAKVIIMIAAAMATKGSSKLITGILAEQAGMSAIHAGSVGGAVSSKLGRIGKDLAGAGVEGVSNAAGALKKAGGMISKPLKADNNRYKAQKEAANAAKLAEAKGGDANAGGNAGGGGEKTDPISPGQAFKDAAYDTVVGGVLGGAANTAGAGAKQAANALSALASMAATGEASDGFVNDLFAQNEASNRKKREAEQEAESQKRKENEYFNPKRKASPQPQSQAAQQASSPNVNVNIQR